MIRFLKIPYDEGFQDGFEIGHKGAYNDGYQDAFEDSYDLVYEDGFVDGNESSRQKKDIFLAVAI